MFGWYSYVVLISVACIQFNITSRSGRDAKLERNKINQISVDLSVIGVDSRQKHTGPVDSAAAIT